MVESFELTLLLPLLLPTIGPTKFKMDPDPEPWPDPDDVLSFCKIKVIHNLG
jgi:hypothetical protein